MNESKKVKGLLFFIIVLIFTAGALIKSQAVSNEKTKEVLYTCQVDLETANYELNFCKFLYKKGVNECEKN